MMHNDALLKSIAHKIATNNYYVNNAQPATSIPLQTAQIFSCNSNDQRVANTISNIIPNIIPTTSIIPQPVEQFTSTPNEKPVKQDPIPEIIPQPLTQPLTQPLQQDADTIVVNKSTIVIIISIVVAFIIIQIWMRQRRLEQLMIAQLHRPMITQSSTPSSVPYE